MHEFDMIDLGRMKCYFSIEVLQELDGIFIHQGKYTHEVIKEIWYR